LDETPIFPSLGKILRARTGSKLSRFFRHIFENKKVKRILGGNLAVAIFASSLIQVQGASGFSSPETTDLKTPFVLSTEKGVQFPTNMVSITQKYSFFHPGIDLDGITGDPIRPILRGKVVIIENSRFAYGKSVIVDHGNGISSRYAHLSKIEVTEGQDVTKDTKIGEMGATGRSFGDHLHLEVYQDGKAINPLTMLR
jgi:murein DD-endopeptidase MepM/ murein hydrolase activator NlpD